MIWDIFGIYHIHMLKDFVKCGTKILFDEYYSYKEYLLKYFIDAENFSLIHQ